MSEGDLKTWIDEWCEAKRVEMRPEDKWQKKRLGLVADAELTVEHLPEVISINDKGEPTGIDTMTYIGILHNAIQELSAKVEALAWVSDFEQYASNPLVEDLLAGNYKEAIETILDYNNK
jgi:hypothetical protein